MSQASDLEPPATSSGSSMPDQPPSKSDAWTSTSGSSTPRQPAGWLRAGIGTVVAVGLFAGGFWAGNNYRIDASQLWPPAIQLIPAQSASTSPLFDQVQTLLENKYLNADQLDQQKLLYGAIAGMVEAAGDPYTAFFDPQENEESEAQLSGKYEGIGAQLGFNQDNQLVIVAPLKNSPAASAGVQAGDAILRIDDQDTVGMSLVKAVNLIRGEAGTTVKITLLREGEADSRTYEITRQEITVESVTLTFKDNPDKSQGNQEIAHLAITRFGDTTNDEWDRAVSQVISQDAKALILDLRNNPGGYFQTAIHVASEFFTDGRVVSQQNANGQTEHFTVERAGRLTDIPVIVLINQGSASASEIVAGALQSQGRARVVGETSFGKGSMQEVIDLAGGTSLHVTIAKWLLPNGQNIDKEGVKPDQEVTMTSEDYQNNVDPQLDAALDEAARRIS